jgi:hypothetical protein
MKKTIHFKWQLLVAAFMFVGFYAQGAEDPTSIQFYPYNVKNADYETLNQTYGMRPDGRKGIEGWDAYGKDGIDTIIVDNTASRVFSGSQSLKVITKGVKNNGLFPYSAAIRTDTIAVDSIGKYIFSFWTKADTAKTDGAYGNAYWMVVRGLDADMKLVNDKLCDSQYGGFGWGSNNTNWNRITLPFTIKDTETNIKFVEVVIQCNYTSNKYWFDNCKLVRRNPRSQVNYLETFETVELPLSVSSIFAGTSIVDQTSKSMLNPVPDPELPSSWKSNLGWGQQIVINTNIKPTSPNNWVLRFKTRFEGGPNNLFAWNSGTNKREPQTDTNKGIFSMQCVLWKTGNIELGNTFINVKVIDDKWIMVQGDLTHAAANLVGNEAIEKITISCGIPGKLYYGNWYIDDIRFGYPPMVKISSMSRSELAAGWELKINPSRDCRLYMAPVGTEITETALEATVNAGTGFRFDNLVGAFDNVIPTSNLNTTANPKDYIVVVYRNAEDFSNGDLITVYPPHNTAKYTAFHISSYPGEQAPSADGFDNDPIWAKVPNMAAIQILNETALRPYNSSEYKATFKAVHDNENIYFLVQATEPKDSLVNFEVLPGAEPSTIKPWTCDAVEFLFRKDSDPKGYIQTLLGHGKSIFEGQTMLINNMTYIDQHTMGNAPAGDNYFFEVVIPLIEIGVTGTPKEGDIINAEIGVFNNNKGYGLPSNYKLVWDGPVFQKVWKAGGIHWGEIKLSRETPNAVHNVSGTKITVAPNPAHNQLIVTNNENIRSIHIYSLTGAKIVDIAGNGMTRMPIDIQVLESGNYLIKVISENNISYSKFIKN